MVLWRIRECLLPLIPMLSCGNRVLQPEVHAMQLSCCLQLFIKVQISFAGIVGQLVT
jgi:hypothetical protein